MQGAAHCAGEMHIDLGKAKCLHALFRENGWRFANPTNEIWIERAKLEALTIAGFGAALYSAIYVLELWDNRWASPRPPHGDGNGC